MANFLEDGARGGLELALERVKRGDDHSLFNPRPDMDEGQKTDFLAQAADGRLPEAYQKALEYHGFKFVPAGELPRWAGEPQEEGQWRHDGLRRALRPSDVTTMFTSPEDLDQWVRREKLSNRLVRRKVPAAERRKLLAKEFPSRR